MSHNSESRQRKALRLSSLYGYGASSKLVRQRAAARVRMANAGAKHFGGMGLSRAKPNAQDEASRIHDEILERSRANAIQHEKSWNFGSHLSEKVLHPVPPAMVEDTTVVMRDAPHTWSSPALDKKIFPLGAKSPYTKSNMARRGHSTHAWATQRMPHNFNPNRVSKPVVKDEFLERVFYGETRADLEKQKRLRALKQKFEKDESNQGRNAGLYTTLSAPPQSKITSKVCVGIAT